jgi:hypothetical protein
MRELSKSQANACEHATNKRCRCRCGGAFHGAGRVTVDELSLLAPDDPHRPAAVRDPVQPTLPAGPTLEDRAAGLEAARAGVADWLATGRLVLFEDTGDARWSVFCVDGPDEIGRLARRGRP